MGDEESKPPRFELRGKKLNVNIDVSMDDMKRHPTVHLSPRAGKTGAGIRPNCLCSPTTHPGSFRCRQHRAVVSVMSRGKSVGSNLSLLGEEHKLPPRPIRNDIQPQSSF